MSRKSHLVRASLGACAMSLVLSASTSWAGVLNLNVHVQPVVIHPHVPTGIGAHNPKQFDDFNGISNNPKGDDGGIGGHSDPGGKNPSKFFAPRGGHKQPGGGQPGEPWNR